MRGWLAPACTGLIPSDKPTAPQEPTVSSICQSLLAMRTNGYYENMTVSRQNKTREPQTNTTKIKQTLVTVSTEPPHGHNLQTRASRTDPEHNDRVCSCHRSSWAAVLKPPSLYSQEQIGRFQNCWVLWTIPLHSVKMCRCDWFKKKLSSQ